MKELTITVEDSIDGRTFTVFIPTADLANVKLDDFDRALLQDIETGESVTIADRLLGLQTIVHRIEQQKGIESK